MRDFFCIKQDVQFFFFFKFFIIYIARTKSQSFGFMYIYVNQNLKNALHHDWADCCFIEKNTINIKQVAKFKKTVLSCRVDYYRIFQIVAWVKEVKVCPKSFML